MDEGTSATKIEKLVTLLKSAQQAISALRADNDKLRAENKRLKEKLTIDIPPSSSHLEIPSSNQNSPSVVISSPNSKLPPHINSGVLEELNMLSRPRRALSGLHPSGLKERACGGWEPSIKADLLFQALSVQNYRTIAKELTLLPICVVRKAFLSHIVSTTSDSVARQEWLQTRRQIKSDIDHLIPILPSKIHQNLNLTMKLVISIATVGEIGFVFATEMLNRIVHHVIASNRSQYKFPWMSFFFGDTLGVWHHLFNWQALCSAIHMPSEIGINGDHFLKSVSGTIQANGEEQSPSTTNDTFSTEHRDVRTSEVVIDTLFIKELEDFALTYFFLKCTILLNGFAEFNRYCSMILYCVNVASSPGILLAILKCSNSKFWVEEEYWFYLFLLSWNVQIDDYIDNLLHAAHEIHAIENNINAAKTRFVIGWMLSSCQRLKKIVTTNLSKRPKALNLVEVQKSAFGLRDDNRNLNDVDPSVAWHKFGFLSILEEISGVLPSFVGNGLTIFLEPFKVISRFMTELASFNLKCSRIDFSTFYERPSLFVSRITGVEDGFPSMEADIVEKFNQFWVEFVKKSPNISAIEAWLTNIMEFIVKPSSHFFDVENRGWIGGQSGDGIRLFVSLQTRVGIMRDHLSNLSKLAPHIPSIPSIDRPCLLFRAFGHYSTYDISFLEKAVSLIQQCNSALTVHLSHLNQLPSTMLDINLNEEADSNDFREKQLFSLFRKLQNIALESTAYVALALIENMWFAILCSIRGLIRCLYSLVHELQTIGPWGKSIKFCNEIVLLCSVLCGNSSNVLVTEDKNIATSLLAQIDDCKVSHVTTYRESTTRVLIPAFVLNLNTRVDRWKRISAMAQRSGLQLIHVPAIDGSLIRVPVDKSMVTVSAGEPESWCISDEDVAPTWHTALNSNFDSGCAPDLTVDLTPSEKACAASHLRIWRKIMEMRKSVLKSKERLHFEFHDELRVCIPVSNELNCREELVVVHDDGVDCYLIMEDDADIKSYAEWKFRSEIIQIIKKASILNWDIIYLGGVIPSKAPFFKGVPVKGGYFMKVNYIWMLHAYIVKGSAIVKLLESLPIQGPVDNFLAKLIYEGTLIAYALGDFIVDQYAGKMSERLLDSNVVRSGVSLTTNVAGYRHNLRNLDEGDNQSQLEKQSTESPIKRSKH